MVATSAAPHQPSRLLLAHVEFLRSLEYIGVLKPTENCSWPSLPTTSETWTSTGGGKTEAGCQDSQWMRKCQSEGGLLFLLLLKHSEAETIFKQESSEKTEVGGATWAGGTTEEGTWEDVKETKMSPQSSDGDTVTVEEQGQKFQTFIWKSFKQSETLRRKTSKEGKKISCSKTARLWARFIQKEKLTSCTDQWNCLKSAFI